MTKHEDLTKAKIVRIFSDINIEEDIAMTVFVFDRPLDSKKNRYTINEKWSQLTLALECWAGFFCRDEVKSQNIMGGLRIGELDMNIGNL